MKNFDFPYINGSPVDLSGIEGADKPTEPAQAQETINPKEKPQKPSKRKCHCGSLYCNICFGYIAAKDMIQTMNDEIKLYGKL
jgi:hypothetical protein